MRSEKLIYVISKYVKLANKAKQLGKLAIFVDIYLLFGNNHFSESLELWYNCCAPKSLA